MVDIGYLTVRHGFFDGPNRNRCFTELNSMVNLPMANWQSHNQMVTTSLQSIGCFNGLVCWGQNVHRKPWFLPLKSWGFPVIFFPNKTNPLDVDLWG